MTGDGFRRLALALPGATEAPHAERTAFRAARIFATLAADGRSANLLLAAEEQALRCEMASALFAPVPGGWGRMGWTALDLAAADEPQVADALEAAWRGAQKRARPRVRRSR